MKLTTTILCTLFLGFISEHSFGQIEDSEGDPYETIFSKNGRIRPTLGFTSEVGSIGNMQLATTGVQLGLIINRKFDFGFFRKVSFNNPSFYDEEVERMLRLAYEGVAMAYHFSPERAVHLSAGMEYGWGNMTIQTGNWVPDWNIAVMTPSINVEMNLTKWSRVNVGLGYRSFANVENLFLDSDDFSNLSMNATLRFGWFR